MRTRYLALALVALAVPTTALAADSAKAPFQVSVTVVRSCRVSTDDPSVTVDCGTRQQPVRITDTRTPSSAPPAPARTAGARAITIEF